MFVEELIRIKESESKADILQKNARVQSKQVLGDARNKAIEVVEDAETAAKTTYDSLLKEGQSISDEQYDSYIQKVKEDCRQMIVEAKKNEEKAIELIAERIVSASVNC